MLITVSFISQNLEITQASINRRVESSNKTLLKNKKSKINTHMDRSQQHSVQQQKLKKTMILLKRSSRTDKSYSMVTEIEKW